MKFVIAPDSFKESMDAITAAQSIKNGLQEVFEDAIFCLYPMADGGEGTLSAIHHYVKDAVIHREWVQGPLSDLVEAKMIHMPAKDEVYIEMAEAAGLMLLDPNKRNPRLTSTYGVGQLVLKALELSPKRIVVALGGSVTNDGGMGFLKALGMKFLDCHGHEVSNGGGSLRDIRTIENKETLDIFTNIEFIVLTDVTNPLLGIRGATHTFSKQKGANHDMLIELETGMENYASLMEDAFSITKRDEQGSGAAGGLGFSLKFLPRVTTQSGIDYILKLSAIENDIKDSDIVFIGEGSLDDQSLHGKVPIGVSLLAKRYGKKVIALVGALKCHPDVLIPYGIDEVYSINEEIGLLQAMLKAAPTNIRLTAKKVAQKMKEYT